MTRHPKQLMRIIDISAGIGIDYRLISVTSTEDRRKYILLSVKLIDSRSTIAHNNYGLSKDMTRR